MFFKKIDERIKVVFIILLLLLLLIILRVFYIQVIDYEKLSTYAEDLWSRELPIEADRGRIIDRNGIVLADNLTTTSLVLIPSQIKDKETTTEQLAKILNVSYEDMVEHVYKETSIERVHPEGRRLSYDIAEQISSLEIEGVYLVKESKRYYPYGNLLSHTLGYVGIDNQGLSGLELQYDEYLTGESGAIKYFSDAKGNQLNKSDVYIEPQDGMDIQLTIDVNIQLSVERELDNIMDMFNPDSALAIVMDPNTGEILAIGSRPDYDPNNYQDYSQEVLSRNLPVWSSYEPGSTFKIVTMATALEEGVISLDDNFYDAGSVKVDGSTLRCWKAGGHGAQTYLQVLENSCNPGFVKIGQLLGKETLFSYLDKFGFGEKTGIDLNGEAIGIIFPLERVGNVELATTAFGQGVSVTPIQQVTAVSAVVNGGYLYQPYVVKNIIESETDTIIQSYSATMRRQVISQATSATMRKALESVVANGGGKSAYIEDYRIGGKTGTAQKAENGVYLVNNYIMSFMAVVPSNNPEAVLYLAIDNPKNTALLSSYTTTPIARRILLDIIDALDIEKQEGELTKDLEWYDKETYEVPNVIGKTLKEAKSLLSNFTIEYSGSGTIIKDQSPDPGEKIEVGSTIKLLLGE